MENKKYNLKKIVEVLYNKSINVSSRNITRPIDNEKIFKDNITMSFINLGGDIGRGELVVRSRFLGSDKFYEYKVPMANYYMWCDIVKQFLEETIDSFDDEISISIDKW